MGRHIQEKETYHGKAYPKDLARTYDQAFEVLLLFND